jgi:hypothetical protein
MSGIDEAKWHWAEGMKFAQKGIELMFFLNGAASISVLTFIGNTKSESAFLVWAIGCFSLGASLTVVLMIIAYLVQLSYGNASLDNGAITNTWSYAAKMHKAAYPLMAACVLCFVSGAILAAVGLLHVQRSGASEPKSTLQQGQTSCIEVLHREKDDTLYEIQLRQTEIDNMTANLKGSLGVSHEWIERKTNLTEKILQLRVKAHDLDLQLAEQDVQTIHVPKGLTLIDPAANR